MKKHKNTIVTIAVIIAVGTLVFIVAKKVMAAKKATLLPPSQQNNQGTTNTTVGSPASKILKKQANPTFDSDVRVLQLFINDYSSYLLQNGMPYAQPIQVDGLFGQATEDALKKDLGITSITVADLQQRQTDLWWATVI